MESKMANKEEIEARIKEALEMFRPQLQADGGDMEYKGLDEQMRVHLVLTGACGSCPMAVMTLKMGVETYIKDAVPEVTEVVQDLPEGQEPMDYGMDGFGGF